MTETKFMPVLIVAVAFSLFVVLVNANEVYQRAVDPETGEEVARVEVVNYCYEFTWLGPADEETTNITSSCEDITLTPEYAGLPCFEPLVWTEGEDAQNGPNLTQIEEQCESSQTIDGTACNPLCTRDDQTCVKMTYYNRNDERTVKYQTRFCGTGIDSSDNGKVITEGCATQDDGLEYDLEACFCQDRDRCNGAINITGQKYYFIILATIGVVFRNILLL